MKYGLISLLGGLVLVSLLAAQAPTPTEPPRPEGGKAPAGQAPAEAQKGTPVPADSVRPGGLPGTGAARGRGVGGQFGTRPPLAPSAQSTAQPDRGPGGFVPSGPSLRSFGPLPDAGAAGKMVMLDVLIAELAEPLTQPMAADLLDMERKGKLKGNARIRLLSLENLPAFTQLGETAPMVVGRTATGLSVMPIYSNVNVGTVLQATSRLDADGTALIQIYVEKSAILRHSSQPPEQREPEGITRILAQSTVRLKPGEPVVLSAGPSNGSDASSQTWMVLTFSTL